MIIMKFGKQLLAQYSSVKENQEMLQRGSVDAKGIDS